VKPPRRLLRALAALALLLLGLTLAVRYLLPVDRFVLAAFDDARALTGAEVTVGDARVDLWPTPRVVLADVAARGTGEVLARAGAAPAGIDDWILTAASVTARPDWRELVRRRAVLRDVRLRQPRLQWSAAGDAAASRAQADAVTFSPLPDILRVQVDAARWGGLVLDIDAELGGWPAPDAVRGTWRLRDCEPGDLIAALPRRPVLGAVPVAALAGGEVEAEGRFDWPLPLPSPLRFRDLAPGLSGHARAAGVAVTFAEIAEPWTVSATAALQTGRLEVSEADVEVGDGRVRGRLEVSGLEREQSAWRFEADGADLPLAELLRVLAPAALPFWEGTADVVASGGCGGGPPGSAEAGLALAAEVRARDGVVHASSWLTDIAPYLGERRDLQDIRYRSLSSGLTLRGGRLALADLRLEGPDTDWRGAGWLEPAGPLDLGLTVKLPAGFRPDLGSLSPLADLLKGDDGRIALGLRLSGRTAAPAVDLDLGASGRRAGWR